MWEKRTDHEETRNFTKDKASSLRLVSCGLVDRSLLVQIDPPPSFSLARQSHVNLLISLLSWKAIFKHESILEYLTCDSIYLSNASLIEKWIAEYRPKAFICRELRCKPITLDSYLKKMGIEYAGNMGGKGKSCPYRKSARFYLHKGSLIHSSNLRQKLLEDKIKAPCCEECGRTVWRGRPIPLELHHVNGDRFDNRLKNLQILCPNCHALTDNNAGKGIISNRLSRAAGVV